mmetsp:Transcript_59490/g.154616  ORF Transcript_59490/g.154616 Transcript_59490/m.154616 type:complete len:218 (-) Transcript_59490:613-1266(-)
MLLTCLRFEIPSPPWVLSEGTFLLKGTNRVLSMLVGLDEANPETNLRSACAAHRLCTHRHQQGLQLSSPERRPRTVPYATVDHQAQINAAQGRPRQWGDMHGRRRAHCDVDPKQTALGDLTLSLAVGSEHAGLSKRGRGQGAGDGGGEIQGLAWAPRSQSCVEEREGEAGKEHEAWSESDGGRGAASHEVPKDDLRERQAYQGVGCLGCDQLRQQGL